MSAVKGRGKGCEGRDDAAIVITVPHSGKTTCRFACYDRGLARNGESRTCAQSRKDDRRWTKMMAAGRIRRSNNFACLLQTRRQHLPGREWPRCLKRSAFLIDLDAWRSSFMRPYRFLFSLVRCFPISLTLMLVKVPILRLLCGCWCGGHMRFRIG